MTVPRLLVLGNQLIWRSRSGDVVIATSNEPVAAPAVVSTITMTSPTAGYTTQGSTFVFRSSTTGAAPLAIEYHLSGAYSGVYAPYLLIPPYTYDDNLPVGDYSVFARATFPSGTVDSAAVTFTRAAAPAGRLAILDDPIPSTGDIRYAATTGSDANPGTIGSPWKTWKNITSGQTLIFRGGSYTATPTSDWNLLRGGGYPSLFNATIRNYPGETVTISGGQYGLIGYNQNVHDVKIHGLNFVNFSANQTGMFTFGGGSHDIEFDGCTWDTIGDQQDEHAIYAGTDASNIVVKNCAFKNVAGGGVHHYSASSASDGITVRECTFKDCRYGVLLTNTGLVGALVERNSFQDCGEGVKLFQYGGSASGVVIQNNIGYANSGKVCVAIDAVAGWCQSWTIAGNIWGKAGTGIAVKLGAATSASPGATASATTPSTGGTDVYADPQFNATTFARTGGGLAAVGDKGASI